MSLHCSLIAIEGDWLDEIPALFEKLRYRVEESFYVPTYEQVRTEFRRRVVGDYKVVMAAYTTNGWTHIMDPRMQLYFEDVWLEYSVLWRTRVFNWICEGCSGSYGVLLFQDGQRLRDVLAIGGEVVTDTGEPLGEEEGANWGNASEEEVLAVADRLGVDRGTPDRGYLVFRLDWSELAPSPDKVARFVRECKRGGLVQTDVSASPRWQWILLFSAAFVFALIWAVVAINGGSGATSWAFDHQASREIRVGPPIEEGLGSR